jgi:glutamate carboxypeptidase
VVSGGAFSNVIPDSATGRVDIRFSRAKDAQILAARLRRLAPILKGAKLEVHGGINRPPLVRDAGVRALFRHAQEIGHSLGLHLSEGSTGGGSDGNFTAALGVPTLDGLGAVGDGAHTPEESIVLRALPERTALLAGLLATL